MHARTSFALIKVNDLPIDPIRPVSVQVQIVTLLGSLERREDNGILLHSMQQVTKHVLAPLAKSVRKLEGMEVCINE